MKKSLLFLLLFVCGNIHAQDCACACVQAGPYVSAFGGANWIHADKNHGVSGSFKTGYAGAAAVGYRFCFDPHVRAEVEIAGRDNSLDYIKHAGHKYRPKTHSRSWSTLVNAYYDFNPNTLFNPYWGIGIGYIQLKSDGHVDDSTGNSVSLKHSNSGAAYQGIVGVSTRICANTDLGLEYRYLLARSNCREQTVGLSLRYTF